MGAPSPWISSRLARPRPQGAQAAADKGQRRGVAAPLAFVSGSLGALIGADLANLDKIQGLGAPIASIGGAGTYDGIFVTGILAVLIASLSGAAPIARANRP